MGTWQGPDDVAGDRLRAEHGIVGAWDGDDLVLSAGSEGLLPEWPPVVNLPGLCVPIPAGAPDVERAVCAGCATVLGRREGEWPPRAGVGCQGQVYGRPAGAIDAVRAADCRPRFVMLAGGGVRAVWPCGAEAVRAGEPAVDVDVLRDRFLQHHHHRVHMHPSPKGASCATS